MDLQDIVQFILFFMICYMGLTVVLIHTELKNVKNELREIGKKLETIIMRLRNK